MANQLDASDEQMECNSKFLYFLYELDHDYASFCFKLDLDQKDKKAHALWAQIYGAVEVLKTNRWHVKKLLNRSISGDDITPTLP